MKTSAYTQKCGGKPGVYLGQVVSGELPQVSDFRNAANLGRAFASLAEKPPISLVDMLSLLDRCREVIEKSDKPSWMSTVRRGLSRLDELYYASDA